MDNLLSGRCIVKPGTTEEVEVMMMATDRAGNIGRGKIRVPPARDR